MARPKKQCEIVKSVRCNLRLTAEEAAKLRSLSIESGRSMSDILRDGLELRFKLSKFGS